MKRKMRLLVGQLKGRFDKPGGADWLIRRETMYGGRHTGIKRNKLSPFDPRPVSETGRGGMTGGDRMYHHGYAKAYEKHLSRFVRSTTKKTIVEVGILKGTGLAIWCDLFPKDRVIGLDIDINHFIKNISEIRRRGGFRRNQPEIYEFDQLNCTEGLLAKILSGGSVDICIDDGLHSEEAILNTFNAFAKFLSQDFCYIVEDNFNISKVLSTMDSDLKVISYGELTVVERY